LGFDEKQVPPYDSDTETVAIPIIVLEDDAPNSVGLCGECREMLIGYKAEKSWKGFNFCPYCGRKIVWGN